MVCYDACIASILILSKDENLVAKVIIIIVQIFLPGEVYKSSFSFTVAARRERLCVGLGVITEKAPPTCLPTLLKKTA